MSGYLLRMMASVQNPGGSIHPLLGSIHAPSPFQTAGEEVSAQDSAPAPDRRLSTFAPRQEVAPVQPEPVAAQSPARIDREETTGRTPPIALPSESPPASENLQEHERPEKVQRRSFPTLVNAGQPEEAAARGVPPSSMSSAAGEFGQSKPGLNIEAPDFAIAREVAIDPKPSQRNDAPVRETGQKNVRDAVYTDRYQPLMQIAPRTEEKSANPFRARVRDAEPRHSSRREAKPDREPDEIQIHIGRIEVLAVPPAPVSAPSKPAGKSPNLGDYLKLRHGRV